MKRKKKIKKKASMAKGEHCCRWDIAGPPGSAHLQGGGVHQLHRPYNKNLSEKDIKPVKKPGRVIYTTSD